MKQIKVDIKPLTVNQAWQGRRFKTKNYKDWQKEFLYLVGKQEPVKGKKLSLTVEFYIKNDKMSDIDNFFKTLQDSLVLSGILEDDRYIYELHAYKYHSEKEFIRITIEEC